MSKRLVSRLGRVALYVTATGVIWALALEIALRTYFGLPIFTLRDWRTLQLSLLQSGMRYDALLGWTPGSNMGGPTFNTLDYGIRKNSGEKEALITGGILAVGDSYTAGSEVADEDTWPAQLEKMLGRRVINAGVMGYGVDQSVLNAERLLPILKPRLVLVGIYEEDIFRVTYKSYNAPKPYFVEQDGQWSHGNHPVPAAEASDPEPLYKSLLSRLLSAHLVLQRYRAWWFTGPGMRFEQVSQAPIKTSCHMLERLHQRLVAEDVVGVVVLQYSAWLYSSGKRRPWYMEQVLGCARQFGYDAVDEFEHIDAIARQSLDRLKQHYVMDRNGSVYGHMSAAGNRLVAGLIADRLQASAASALGRVAQVPPVLDQPAMPGLDRVIIDRSETSSSR
jgi:hypothetical protein